MPVDFLVSDPALSRAGSLLQRVCIPIVGVSLLAIAPFDSMHLRNLFILEHRHRPRRPRH